MSTASFKPNHLTGPNATLTSIKVRSGEFIPPIQAGDIVRFIQEGPEEFVKLGAEGTAMRDQDQHGDVLVGFFDEDFSQEYVLDKAYKYEIVRKKEP